jgi:hypothetical protein
MSEYSHPSITALTLNSRGMHTTILDLQNLLATQTPPHIIALAETKHRHIKSIWRHTLKGCKLVHNPSLYNKHTKRCTGGTILAINTTTYSSIEPYKTPSHLQYHIAMALLTPKVGSKIIAISLYMPQHNTAPGNKTYNKALQWLNRTLTKDLPHAAVILGATSKQHPQSAISHTIKH